MVGRCVHPSIPKPTCLEIARVASFMYIASIYLLTLICARIRTVVTYLAVPGLKSGWFGLEDGRSGSDYEKFFDRVETGHMWIGIGGLGQTTGGLVMHRKHKFLITAFQI